MSLFIGTNGPLAFVLLGVDGKELKELKKIITENGGVLAADNSNVPIRFIPTSYKISADFVTRFKCYDIQFIRECVKEKRIVDSIPYRLGKKLLFDECLISHFLFGGCECRSRVELDGNIRDSTIREALRFTSPPPGHTMSQSQRSSDLSDPDATPIGSMPAMTSDLSNPAKNTPPITLSASTVTLSGNLPSSPDSMSPSEHLRSCSDSPTIGGDGQNNSPIGTPNRQNARHGNLSRTSEDDETDDNAPIDDSQLVVTRPRMKHRPTQLSSGDGKSTEFNDNDEKRPCSLEYKLQVEPKMRALVNERRKVVNSLGLVSRMTQQRTATTLSNAHGTANVPLPEIAMDSIEDVPESLEIPEQSLSNEPVVKYLVKEEVMDEPPPSPASSQASTIILNSNQRRCTRRNTRKHPRRVKDDAPTEDTTESGWIVDTYSQQQICMNTAAVTTWPESGGDEKPLLRESAIPLPPRKSTSPSPKKRRHSLPRSSCSPLPRKRCHSTSKESSVPSKKRCESPMESSSLEKTSTSSSKQPSASSPRKQNSSASQKSHSSTPIKAQPDKSKLDSTLVKNPYVKGRNARSPRKAGSMKDLDTSEHLVNPICFLNDSTDDSTEEMVMSRIPTFFAEANDQASISLENVTENADKSSTNFEDDSRWNLPGTSSGARRSRTVPQNDTHFDSMSDAEFREKLKVAKGEKDAILARVNDNSEKSANDELVDERSKKSHKKVADKTNSLKKWRNENARVDRAHDISNESSDDEPTYSYLTGTQRRKKTTGTLPNEKENEQKVVESRQEKKKVTQKQIIKRPVREKDCKTKSNESKLFIPDHPVVRRFGLSADFLPKKPETAWTRLRAITVEHLKEREKKESHREKRANESGLSEKTKRPARKVEIRNNHGKVLEIISSDDDDNHGNNDSGSNEDRSPKKSKPRIVKNPWCKVYKIDSRSDDDKDDEKKNYGSNESRLSKKTKRPMQKNSPCNGDIQNKRWQPYEFNSSSDKDNNGQNNNYGSKVLKKFYNQEKPKLHQVKSKPIGMSEKSVKVEKQTKTKYSQSRESNDEDEEDNVIMLSHDSLQGSTAKRLSDKKKSNTEKSKINRHTENQRKVRSKTSICSQSSSDNDNSDKEVVLKTNQPDKSKRSSTESHATKSPNKSEVPKKPANLYTDFENEQLIFYLINNNSISIAREMAIFKEMSHDKNLRHRSAKSLSTQFHEVILPNIDEYAQQFKISSITVAEFKELLNS